MKTLILCLSVVPTLIGAVELLIPQTSTGPYEVCISAPSPDNGDAGHKIAFRERATQKVIGITDGMGGYLRPSLAVEDTKVLWHPSGRFVAFTDHGTKNSITLHVYSLLDGEPVKLKYADYLQNALGHVGAINTGGHYISTPLSWTGDELEVGLYFSADYEQKGRQFYKTLVKLQLSHGPNTAPRLRLLSVEKPKDANE